MNKEIMAIKKKEFEENGYTIFRHVIDIELLQRVNQHLDFLAKKFPNIRPEHYHHPLIRDDAFWVKLITDKRLLDIAELFLGQNIANFTAHYICKPPHDGQAVLWHQDGAYWNLNPMNAVTLWLAIDSSTPDNGCLKIIPGTHKNPVGKLKLRNDTPNMLYSETAHEFDESAAINIVLNPGDVSVHNPLIIHGSEANKSKYRRCGLDLGFIPTNTQILSKELYLNPILARGKAAEGINQYRPWPKYSTENTIFFPDHQEWDITADKMNQQSGVIQKNKYDDVETITERMIQRLKQGNTAA